MSECKFFEYWKNELKKYCKDSGLDYEKAINYPMGVSPDFMDIVYPEEERIKKAKGLLDDTPMKPILTAHKENGRVVFEETDITRKYLSV